jgi:hypothetical protein
MGPLGAGLIMRELDLPHPALPIRLMKGMVVRIYVEKSTVSTILLDLVFVM